MISGLGQVDALAGEKPMTESKTPGIWQQSEAHPCQHTILSHDLQKNSVACTKWSDTQLD